METNVKQIQIYLRRKKSLLVLFQSQGPHIYQTCPSANYYDCKAMAIGARSQSARTYVEKHLDKFLDSMFEHGSLFVTINISDTIIQITGFLKICITMLVLKDLDGQGLYF